MACFTFFLNVLASWECFPSFQAFLLANLAPEPLPPCTRQRVFPLIAGHRQGNPWFPLVRAPHLGACSKAKQIFSVLEVVFTFLLSLLRSMYISYYRLTTFMHIHTPNHHRLTDRSLKLSQQRSLLNKTI